MSDKTTPQDSAAMSPASAGSRGPIAWAAVNGYGDVELLGHSVEAVSDDYSGRSVVPLYRSPTLTDEEREAVEVAVRHVVESDGIGTAYAFQISKTLRSLLERLG